MKKILLLLLISCYSLLYAQSSFQFVIGGSLEERAFSIVQTADTGYAVFGLTRSFGGTLNKGYVLKLNSGMNLQWSKTVSSIYTGYSLKQTRDGGYALAGPAGMDGFYIGKLDAGGSVQWIRRLGSGNAEQSYSIVQTTDSGYAAVGFGFNFGYPDFYIVRLDVNGNFQWCRRIGGNNDDRGFSIIQTADGGYAAAGITATFGAGMRDYFVIKLDSSGTYQWSRTIGGTGDEGGLFDAMSIIQTTDGGYTLAGYTNSFGAGNTDMYIVKLNSSGTLHWSRTIGGPNADGAYSIIQARDGGYVAVGYTNSFGAGGYDMYIIKLNSNGSLMWSKTVGGTNHERARSIIQNLNGGYTVAGNTNSFGAGNQDVYVVKLDSNGYTCTNSSSPPSISGIGGTMNSPTPVVTSITPPVTNPSPAISSGGIVNTLCVVGIQPFSYEIPDEFKLFQNYPNPFNPTTNIKFDLPLESYVALKIYDLLGREIAILKSEYLKAGTHEVEWDASNYPSGIYFCRLKYNSYTETMKMVLIK